MRTGVETDAEKYVAKEMIRFAYENLERGFDSHMLKQQFPKEFLQGPCVFSMTEGILEKLVLAKWLLADPKVIISNFFISFLLIEERF